MVVPVLVAFGKGTPRAWSAALRVWFEKSKPGMITRRASGAREFQRREMMYLRAALNIC